MKVGIGATMTIHGFSPAPHVISFVPENHPEVLRHPVTPLAVVSVVSHYVQYRRDEPIWSSRGKLLPTAGSWTTIRN